MSVHYWILLFDFISGAVLGSLIILILLYIAYHNRLFDEPDFRKVHHVPIPRLGGMSFLPTLIIVVSFTIVTLYRLNLTAASFFENRHFVQLTYMLISALILYLTGAADDLSGLNYKVKLLVQFLAASVLVLSGLYLTDLYGLFGIHQIPRGVGIPLSILLVVFITNAINMIDGIDGLASGMGLITLSGLFLMFFVERKFVYAMVAATLLGSLLAFWHFNMFGTSEKKTKLFMGDTGSLTLGIVLSYLIFNLGSFVGHRGLTEHRNIIYFTLVFASLMIPLMDVLRLFFYRLKLHKSPFLPDMNHIHHKIMRCGYTPRQTLWILLGADLLVVLVDTLLSLIPLNVNLIVVVDLALYAVWLARIDRRLARQTHPEPAQ